MSNSFEGGGRMSPEEQRRHEHAHELQQLRNLCAEVPEQNIIGDFISYAEREQTPEVSVYNSFVSALRWDVANNRATLTFGQRIGSDTTKIAEVAFDIHELGDEKYNINVNTEYRRQSPLFNELVLAVQKCYTKWGVDRQFQADELIDHVMSVSEKEGSLSKALLDEIFADGKKRRTPVIATGIIMDLKNFFQVQRHGDVPPEALDIVRIVGDRTEGQNR